MTKEGEASGLRLFYCKESGVWCSGMVSTEPGHFVRFGTKLDCPCSFAYDALAEDTIACEEGVLVGTWTLDGNVGDGCLNCVATVTLI